jgi:IS30 family transposase
MLKMKQRPSIYYSEAQKAQMWDRWQKDDSVRAIAQPIDRGHTSVQCILSRFVM